MSREAKVQLGLFLLGGMLVAVSVLGLASLRQRFEFREGVIPGRTATRFTKIRLREPRQEKPPVALVLHGLTSNRRIMFDLAESLAAAGLDTYAVDLPGHGDSPRPFTYSEARAAAQEAVLFLVFHEGYEPRRILLVGHSMGGHLALETAWTMPELAATVTISGLPRRFLRVDRPRNILFLTGSLDFGPQRQGAYEMFRLATGRAPVTDTTVGDFAQGTARRLVSLPYATHTGLIYTTATAQEVVGWARQAMLGARLGPPLSLVRLLGIEWLGVAGLIVLFAPVCYGLARALRAAPTGELTWTSRLADERPARLFVFLLANAWLAVSLLRIFNPLAFTRIFTGSYLAGFLFIQSVCLLAFVRRGTYCMPWRGVLKALAAVAAPVAYTILLAAAFLNWQMTDALPTLARLGRLALLLPFLFAYFQGEESLLRALERRGGRRAAWSWFLRARLLALAALWYGVVVLGSGHVLVILMAHILIAGTILLFGFSSILYRRFGSVSACALFDAILAGWFLATVLPVT